MTAQTTTAAPVDGDASALDWELAEKVAVRTSGDTGFARSRRAVTMPAELRSLTELSQGLVEDFTNLRSRAGAAHAEVIDRPRFGDLIDDDRDRGDDDRQSGQRQPTGLTHRCPIPPTLSVTSSVAHGMNSRRSRGIGLVEIRL